MKTLTATFLFILLITPSLRAENAVRAGEFVVEPPTLICLGFEWEISGDENRNATVAVSYRRSGQSAWTEGLPLLRMGGEKIFRAPYTVPDRFAGSILDLEPDTEYEVRLTMTDPEGVSGQSVQTATVRTRGEPKAATGGRVLHVYPPEWTGPKEEPSFTGLMAAYAGAGTGDWNVVFQRKVGPGDIILVHAGLYKGDRTNYVDPLSTTFDGAYLLTAKGTADRPIVIRAAGDGEVIFDGDEAFRLFDVMGADYHIFEGLTIRNTEVAFWAGVKDVAGAVGLTVRNCRIENVGVGVTTQYAGSKDFYIADNIFLGRDDRDRVLGWANPGIYGAHPLNSYYAVKVYGSGHVIAHNAVAFFHDGITVCTHGVPEPQQALKAVAIDIYNNDIHVTGDDVIEADGGVHNIRVMRNRGVNAAHTGLSAQPIFGGPAYYIRHILYNTPVALKLNNPAGVIVYHNTIIAENRTAQRVSNAHFRNNLFLGTDAAGRGISALGGPTAYSTYDYNGYRPNRRAQAQYVWLGPRAGLQVDYESTPDKGRPFETLAELAAATGQETHGIEIDYDIFESLRAPSPPDSSKPGPVYDAVDLNFRLKPGSKAVDAGDPLPNVNDGFAGSAPDLGAYEVGQTIPVYGPRWLKQEPFYR
ncbi:MAG: hypothetical protein GEV06_15475 [Luteitalea sp.]|nr:hypothetical protein [Luteitalea sp.]